MYLLCTKVYVFLACDGAMVMSELEKSEAAVVIEISKRIRVGSICMGRRRVCIGITCRGNNMMCMRMCVNGFGEIIYGSRQSTQPIQTDASVVVHKGAVDLVIVVVVVTRYG